MAGQDQLINLKIKKKYFTKFKTVLKNILNIGPQKAAARPIEGYPALAIEVSETKSPKQLPQAITVMPSIESDRSNIIPNVDNSDTISPEITFIKITPTPNPINANMEWYIGFFVGSDVARITMIKIEEIINSKAQTGKLSPTDALTNLKQKYRILDDSNVIITVMPLSIVPTSLHDK